MPSLFRDKTKSQGETSGKQIQGQKSLTGTDKMSKGVLKAQTPIDEDLLEMEEEVNRN